MCWMCKGAMHEDMGKRLGCIGWLLVKARKCRFSDDESPTAIDRLMHRMYLIWAARKVLGAGSGGRRAKASTSADKAP